MRGRITWTGGRGGINTGYSAEQFRGLQSLFLSQARVKPTYLRTRLDLLLGHFLVLRGESRRMAELCDFHQVTYPAREGPTPCIAIVLTMSQSKTNTMGKKQFMGAIRHKEPELCTLGAFAEYLFYRFHIAGEKPPNFKSRRSWYRTKCLLGKGQNQLSYAAQLEATHIAFMKVGVVSTMVTHVPRSEGAKYAELYGVAEEEVSMTPLCLSSEFSSLVRYSTER